MPSMYEDDNGRLWISDDDGYRESVHKVRNTTKHAQENPRAMLFDLLGHRPIEHQEERGQRESVSSMSLPTKHLHDYAEGGKYAALGFKIGKEVPGDEMFTYVELPEGWTKKPSDHSMYVHILDEKGRRRAQYFYKAAFYDRDAIMWAPDRRYNIAHGHNNVYGECAERYVIDSSLATWGSDGQVCKECVLHTVTQKFVDNGVYKFYQASGDVEAEAQKWLDENFPDNRDPLKYWD